MALAEPPRNPGDHPEDPNWKQRLANLAPTSKRYAETKVLPDKATQTKLLVLKWFVRNAKTYTRISVIRGVPNRKNLAVVQVYDEFNFPRRCFFDFNACNNINYMPNTMPQNLWKSKDLEDKPAGT